MSDLKFKFIHITKNGGTNFKMNILDKRKEKNISYFGAHDKIENIDDNTIYFAFLREPVDRYISLFKYNMFGSNGYRKNGDYTDINTFVKNHHKNRNMVKKYENIQFDQQTKWLYYTNKPKFLYVILYDKKI